MRKRSERRAGMRPRYWHTGLCAIAGTGIFVVADWLYMDKFGDLPDLMALWGLAAVVPLLIGMVVTLGAGGAPLWKRIAGAALCGVAVGGFSTVVSGVLATNDPIGGSPIAITGIWRAFVFTLVSVVGVLGTETMMPEPQQNTR